MSVFSLNTGKCRPEKIPYLGPFDVVRSQAFFEKALLKNTANA